MTKKKNYIILIIAGLFWFSALCSALNNDGVKHTNNTSVRNENSTNNAINISNEVKKEDYNTSNDVLTCDGTTITSNCIYDGKEYKIYKYYPKVEAKTHKETETTYTKEIVGYCTLCNDGTRSPSCATGRGACSHHGGVRQFNAPIYREVPHTSTKEVIDQEEIPERWEKVLKMN